MKVAVYSKVGCGICVAAKNKIEMMGFTKVAEPGEWSDGTWVERDVEQVNAGLSENWRLFPDCECLAFTMLHDLDALPIIWIDGEFHTYANAMRTMKAKLAERKEPVAVPA